VGDGEIGFATGHAPFVGALEIAKVVVRPPEGPTRSSPSTVGSSR